MLFPSEDLAREVWDWCLARPPVASPWRALGKLLLEPRSSAFPTLPGFLRPDVVTDVCVFLRPEHNEGRSVEDKIRFLAGKDVALNEISAALRLSPAVSAPLAPAAVLRAHRKVRDDILDSAMSFFQSEKIQTQPVEERVSFLVRQKGVTNDEISELLDRLSIPQEISADGGAPSPRPAAPPPAPPPPKAQPPKSTPPLPPPSSSGKNTKLLDQAVEFLKHSTAARNASPSEKTAFLKGKGLTEDQIKQALDLAASSSSGVAGAAHSEAVERAVNFLNNPSTRGFPVNDKIAFLKNKGVSEQDIQQALEIVGGSNATSSTPTPSKSGTSDVQVNRAVEFLNNPSTRNFPVGEKVAFLKNKGLTDDQIKQALDVAVAAAPATSASSPPAWGVVRSPVERAVEFLNNPSTKQVPIPEKVAFLKKQGLTEAQIDKALEMTATTTTTANNNNNNSDGSLTPNRTSSTSSDTNTPEGSKPLPPIPNDRIIVKQVMALLESGATTDTQDMIQRCALLAALTSVSVSHLRFPASVVKRWCAVAAQAFAECCARQTLGEESDQTLFETALGEMLEMCANHQHVVNLVPAILQPVQRMMARHGLVWSVDAGLSLARCVHGHLCARASVQPYHTRTWLHDTPPQTSSSNDDVENLCLAGLLRGAVDFGCGIGAPVVPAEEKNEKNVAPERDMRARLNALSGGSKPRPQTGFACVYAGTVWLDADKTWGQVASALFDGSLHWVMPRPPPPPGSKAPQVLDACVSAANAFVKSGPFRLAASVAQVLVAQCSSTTAAAGVRKPECLQLVIAFATRTFDALRELGALSTIVAKRMVERTYDERLSQLSLEDALGVHASLGRVFQTHYLVCVIVLECCLTPMDAVSLDDAVSAWNALAGLGFALVPVPEAIQLNKSLETLVGVNSLSDSWSEVAFVHLAKCCWNHHVSSPHHDATTTSSPEREDGDDWVLAAKIEYLMDTGKQFMRSSWMALAPRVSCENEIVELDSFTQALIFGASHPFSALNRRCHTLLTESISLSSTARATSLAQEGDEQEAPVLALALIPEYLQRSVETCPSATDGASFAYVVGSVFTALNSHPDSRARPLAAVVFFRLVHETKRACFPPGQATREHKTRAELLCTLVFASLKALSLPTLAASLDAVEGLFRTLGYYDQVLDVGKSDRKPVLRFAQVKQTLFEVVTRVDDAPRRAVLVMWFLKCIKPMFLVAKEEEKEEQAVADLATAKL